MRKMVWAVVFSLVAVFPAFSQTIEHELHSNVSACEPGFGLSPLTCTVAFKSHQDTRGVATPFFNPKAQSTSKVKIKDLLYPGLADANKVKVFANVIPAFEACADDLSAANGRELRASPTGLSAERCKSKRDNVIPEYSNRDRDTTLKQIADLRERGFDGVVLDMYQAGSAQDIAGGYFAESNMPFVIMYDGGMMKFPVTYPWRVAHPSFLCLGGAVAEIHSRLLAQRTRLLACLGA